MGKSFLPPLVHEHHQHSLVVGSCVALGMVVVVVLLYWLSVSMSPDTNVIVTPAPDARAQMIEEAVSKLKGSPPTTPEQWQAAISKLKVNK